MNDTERRERVRITYETMDLGSGVESGTVVGSWIDEYGLGGQQGFAVVGGPTLYLFENEIVSTEEAPQTGCPECGSAELRYMEPVWCDRRLSTIADDGTLMFDGLAEVNWEASEEEMGVIHCDGCHYEWKPNAGSLDFV